MNSLVHLCFPELLTVVLCHLEPRARWSHHQSSYLRLLPLPDPRCSSCSEKNCCWLPISFFCLHLRSLLVQFENHWVTHPCRCLETCPGEQKGWSCLLLESSSDQMGYSMPAALSRRWCFGLVLEICLDHAIIAEPHVIGLFIWFLNLC